MAATDEITNASLALDDNETEQNESFESLFSSSACPLIPIAVAFEKVQADIEVMQTVPLLTAFEGISTFLDSLGIAPLAFVRKDIVLKITTIKALLPTDHSELEASPYYRVLSGFEHECGAKTHTQQSSMVWNLVRLKRALLFVTEFVRGLSDASKPVSECCHSAYVTTFETLHPWTVRKLVSVAVYALPSRPGFLQRLKIADEDEAAVLLQRASETLGPVFAALQQAFDRFSLGHLR